MKEKIKVKVAFYDDLIKQETDKRDKMLKSLINPIDDNITQLEKERIKYIFDNKLYKTFPLDKKYVGWDIDEVCFINNNGTIDYLYNDDIFEVDDDGYPYFSSNYCGITQHEEDGFYHYYYHNKTKMPYIGYINIELKTYKNEEGENE